VTNLSHDDAPFDSAGATPGLVVGSAAIPANLFQCLRDICPQMRRGVVVAIETLLEACACHFLGRAIMFVDQDVSETFQFLAVTHIVISQRLARLSFLRDGRGCDARKEPAFGNRV